MSLNSSFYWLFISFCFEELYDIGWPRGPSKRRVCSPHVTKWLNENECYFMKAMYVLKSMKRYG